MERIILKKDKKKNHQGRERFLEQINQTSRVLQIKLHTAQVMIIILLAFSMNGDLYCRADHRRRGVNGTH